MITTFNIRRAQNGSTLFLGLMFLLVLTLVALVTMQGTTLELKMANNGTQQVSAFQVSETLRTMAGEIVNANTQNRGMQQFVGNPAVWTNTGTGGAVGSQSGGGTTCTGAAFSASQQLYAANTNPSYSTTWHSIAGVFQGNIPNATAATIAGNPSQLMTYCPGGTSGAAAWANVFNIGTRPNPGSGTAINEGALGQGNSSDSNKWFEIRSQGQIGNGAIAITASEYRVPIRQ
jgi:Tfp pilus assembly protein PilX